jgi:quercetin dioxygenase-like cupin family protein
MTISRISKVRFAHQALALAALCMIELAALPSASAQGVYADCLPVSERTNEIGCWIIANQPVGQLPQRPVFWHLDKFATRAAAEASKDARGTVVQALGKVWLLTISEAGWRPAGGERVAEIGPLVVSPGTKYMAQYMEAIMTPGMKTRIHRHPGPEAWYTESGETCLESPGGKQVGQKGVSVIVPGGQPMKLTVTGKEQRRSLVLILHDASQPATSMATDWTPKGLCGR